MDWPPQKRREAEGGGGNSDSQKGKEGQTVKQGRNRKNGQRFSVCLLTTGTWESELSQKSRQITFLKKEMECQNTTRSPLDLTGGCQPGGGGDTWAAARGLIKAAREALLWQLLGEARENAALSSPSRTSSRLLPFCFTYFLYCFSVFNFIDSCS